MSNMSGLTYWAPVWRADLPASAPRPRLWCRVEVLAVLLLSIFGSQRSALKTFGVVCRWLDMLAVLLLSIFGSQRSALNTVGTGSPINGRPRLVCRWLDVVAVVLLCFI